MWQLTTSHFYIIDTELQPEKIMADAMTYFFEIVNEIKAQKEDTSHPLGLLVAVK